VLAALVLAILFVLTLIFLPTYKRWIASHQSTPECARNLRQIGQALLLYAMDHHSSTYPDDLMAIFDEDVNPNILICPEGTEKPARAGPTTRETIANVRAGAHCSYVYLGKGMSIDAKFGTVLAYCQNHNGTFVLFGDGSTIYLNRAESASMLAELRAGYNPPRVGTVPSLTIASAPATRATTGKVLSASTKAASGADEPMKNLVRLKKMPRDLFAVVLVPDLNANPKRSLDERSLRMLIEDGMPLDPADVKDDGWSYAPWYSGSFGADEGRYEFNLFLGGRGTLRTPTGDTAFFSYAAPAKR
jgi:hypothetical protein